MKQLELRRLPRNEEREMERAMREVMARKDPRVFSRRHFMRTGSGLIVVSLLPLGVTGTGCDPVTAGLAISGIIALIDVVKDAFKLDEDVRGRVQVMNDGPSSVSAEILLQLMAQQAGIVDEGIAPVTLKPGGSGLYEYGDLYGQDPGTHSVKGTIATGSKKTIDFQLVS